MTKLAKITFCSLALSLVLNVFAAETTKQVKKFLIAEIARGKAAFQKKDLSYFERISTADFYIIDCEGTKKNKEESLNDLKEMFAMAKTIRTDTKLTDLKVDGSYAVAKLTSHFTIRLKPDEKGKSSIMTMTMWSEEGWKKVGNTWKIASLKSTKPAKCTLDGKPFDPTKMKGHGHEHSTPPADHKKP